MGMQEVSGLAGTKTDKKENTNKKKKKEIKLVIGVLTEVIAVILVGILVYAFLTSEKAVKNEVKIGNNTIEIEEDFVPPVKQMKNTIFKKKVQVKNTGNVPCYVRVYADFSDGTIRDISYFSNDAGALLDEEKFSDENYVNGISVGNTYGFYCAKRDTTDNKNYVYEENLPANWVFIPDNENGDDSVLKGYYYYTKEVPAGGLTEPLFTYILTKYTSESDIKQFDVIVYGESIQVTDKNGDIFEDDEPAGVEAWRKAWREFLSN